MLKTVGDQVKAVLDGHRACARARAAGKPCSMRFLDRIAEARPLRQQRVVDACTSFPIQLGGDCSDNYVTAAPAAACVLNAADVEAMRLVTMLHDLPFVPE